LQTTYIQLKYYSCSSITTPTNVKPLSTLQDKELIPTNLGSIDADKGHKTDTDVRHGNSLKSRTRGHGDMTRENI